MPAGSPTPQSVASLEGIVENKRCYLITGTTILAYMDVSDFQVTHLTLYPVLVAPSNLYSHRDWASLCVILKHM